MVFRAVKAESAVVYSASVPIRTGELSLFHRPKRAVFTAILSICALSSAGQVGSASAARTNPLASYRVSPPSLSAARSQVPPPPPAVVGARLTAAPAITDVGDGVTLTLTATHFTPKSTVILRFVSPHHGFSGNMPWDVRCNCFRLAVFLAKRSHPLELAHASAVITAGKSTTSVYTTFEIRGLTPDGAAYVSGGIPTFSVWVGDPSPVSTEFQHYCVWARTADALGVAGLTVRLSVHFQQHTENWRAGVTGPSGVLCVRRSIGHPIPGFKVLVDAYADNLHAQTSFIPVG